METIRDEKGRWKKGYNPYNKGKHLSKKTKLLISNKKKGKHSSIKTEFKKGRIPFNKGRNHLSGDKHWNWKGGISPERKRAYQSYKYKKWRMDIFLRDNFTCQFCGLRGVYMEAHHIKEWSKFPDLRYNIDNGVCLCNYCHNLTKKGKEIS